MKFGQQFVTKLAELCAEYPDAIFWHSINYKLLQRLLASSTTSFKAALLQGVTDVDECYQREAEAPQGPEHAEALRDWASLNYVAVLKLLKKHDKECAPGRQIMKEFVQSFHTTAFFTNMHSPSSLALLDKLAVAPKYRPAEVCANICSPIAEDEIALTPAVSLVQLSPPPGAPRVNFEGAPAPGIAEPLAPAHTEPSSSSSSSKLKKLRMLLPILSKMGQSRTPDPELYPTLAHTTVEDTTVEASTTSSPAPKAASTHGPSSSSITSERVTTGRYSVRSLTWTTVNLREPATATSGYLSKVLGYKDTVMSRALDEDEACGLLEGREDIIVASLPEALERERYWSLEWTNLARHKMWASEPGPPVKIPKLKPYYEWANGEIPWPGGDAAHEAGFFALLTAFVKFMYRMRSDVARQTIFAYVCLGFFPALTLISLAEAVSLIEQTDDVLKFYHAEQLGFHALLGIFIGLFILFNCIEERISYWINCRQPQSSCRWHLRHVIQRHLLLLRGEVARRYTPGVTALLLDRVVGEAVDLIWGAFLAFWRIPSSIFFTSWALMFVKHDLSVVWLPVLLICVAVIYIGVLLLYFCKFQMAREMEAHSLRQQWRFRYIALASAQVQRRYQYRSEEAREEAAHLVSTAACISRLRNKVFNAYNQSGEWAMKVFSLLVFSGLIIAFAEYARGGEADAGSFVLIIKIIETFAKDAAAYNLMLKNLPAGHTALVQLAAVINATSGKRGTDETFSSGAEVPDTPMDYVRKNFRGRSRSTLLRSTDRYSRFPTVPRHSSNEGPRFQVRHSSNATVAEAE